MSLKDIDKSNIPRHVAIIMDGNGRWAKKKGLRRENGHREGRKSVRKIVECCVELGIKNLTLYAFSTEAHGVLFGYDMAHNPSKP